MKYKNQIPKLRTCMLKATNMKTCIWDQSAPSTTILAWMNQNNPLISMQS